MLQLWCLLSLAIKCFSAHWSLIRILFSVMGAQLLEPNEFSKGIFQYQYSIMALDSQKYELMGLWWDHNPLVSVLVIRQLR